MDEDFSSRHAYPLPDYENLILHQDSPSEAAEIMLNLLSNRYVTAILTHTMRTIVKAWGEAESWKAHYQELLEQFPMAAREQLAICHAMFATGETPPDPENIPAPSPKRLLEDWDELDDDAQENVILNAVNMLVTMRINSGQHPYAIVLLLMLSLPSEAQSSIVSQILTQYTRQYHASRMNRN
jgi:hypothetical protein